MADELLKVNTGVLIGERPEDYKFGATSPIKHEVRNSTRDWRPFRSKGEPQNLNPADRMACVSFSAADIWEQQANWMLENNLWPADALKFWQTNNYIQAGKFIISRRFLAKVSGTTKDGNFFYKVWDSVRKQGVVPDGLYPDNANLNWEQYYQEMPVPLLSLGLESLKYFSLLYESVTASPAQMLVLRELSPLQFGVSTLCGWSAEVPVCAGLANHAVDNDFGLTDLSFDIFDSYDPFAKHLPRGYPIPICYRAVIYPINRAQPVGPAAPTSPEALPEDIGFGESGPKVAALKAALTQLGWPCLPDTVYNQGLADVVFRFQLANVSHTFIEMIWNLKGRKVGPLTRAVINDAINNKK